MPDLHTHWSKELLTHCLVGREVLRTFRPGAFEIRFPRVLNLEGLLLWLSDSAWWNSNGHDRALKATLLTNTALTVCPQLP
jgi:hypothetical protein